MNWINEPENLSIETRGCGTNICWSRYENQNCIGDYCVIRVCLTKFCYKNY